jgi:estrone sulfotransferase
MAPRLLRPLVRLVHGRWYYDWNVFPHVSAKDVYLVSYPRSGNTWLRAFVTAYLLDRPLSSELVQSTVPDVYRVRRAGPVGRRSSRGARLFKSHSPYQRLPARVIYLVRDGRDVMLSYFNYMRRYEAQRGVELEVTPADFYLAHHPYGTWDEHVLGWLAGLESWPRDRKLVLRYEDLVSEPERTFKAVVWFLGLDVDRARLRRAIERSDKRALVAAERASGEGALEYPGLTTESWREVLAPDDVARFEQRAG